MSRIYYLNFELCVLLQCSPCKNSWSAGIKWVCWYYGCYSET